MANLSAAEEKAKAAVDTAASRELERDAAVRRADELARDFKAARENVTAAFFTARAADQARQRSDERADAAHAAADKVNAAATRKANAAIAEPLDCSRDQYELPGESPPSLCESITVLSAAPVPPNASRTSPGHLHTYALATIRPTLQVVRGA
jgi:hypothetical protein